MNTIAESFTRYKDEVEASHARLVAVSKTKPIEYLQEAYEAGCRIFGENKVQELVPKWEALPKDIEWHFIGHLQSNKVKYMAPFVSLIHSVDSERLLEEINKQAQKHERIIDVLLQVYIAKEETKFGFSAEELAHTLQAEVLSNYPHVRIAGLMGMASNTDDEEVVRNEFSFLASLFNHYKNQPEHPQISMKELSMGMSNDYKIALQEGSTLVRIGSAIFGSR